MSAEARVDDVENKVDPTTVKNTEHMTLPLQIGGSSDFIDVRYAIVGWHRTSDSLTLLTPVGDTTTITAKAATLALAGGPNARRRQPHAGCLGNTASSFSMRLSRHAPCMLAARGP